MILQDFTRFSAMLAFALFAGAAAAADGDPEQSAVARWQDDPTTIFDATEVDIKDFEWIARPLVIFAETSAMPVFSTQLELLNARFDELEKRDVVVIIDTSPDKRSELRTKLRPRGFMIVLIGKDGGVKLRKPFPWDVRELTRQIDKMPIRKQEIRDQLQAE